MPDLKAITATLQLPSEITDFERNYLARVNRIGMGFFALHLPVFVLVAWLNETRPWLAFSLTSALLVGPFLALRTFDNPRAVSVVHGFTAMLMGGLLVHFGQGPVQIEMHFYFFALLAMLALFGNPMVIITAAATVSVHHLVLWWLLPSSVFNYDAPIWVVLVHALFVVVESVATIYIARSFFDNVIGLEKIVNERTCALDDRNRDMRLVLDNVAEGLLTIDAQGRMSAEHSRPIDTWFGECTAELPLDEVLGRKAPEFAEAFRIAYDQMAMGILPFDVAADQIPTDFDVDGRSFSVEYRPLLNASGDELERTLVVISDVTAIRERERLERDQAEVVRVFDRVLSDRAGFLEFYEEACDLVESIAGDTIEHSVALKRALHTLKGNAMVFGVGSIADQCHAMESALVTDAERPTKAARDELLASWSRLSDKLQAFVGDGRARIEVPEAQYDELLNTALEDALETRLPTMIADLRLEPTVARLERVAEQAKRIARRLGKGDIEVRIDDNMLRLEPRRWAEFWSAFVHVIRNAVDHGIEEPSARKEAGKPECGTLSLATVIEGDEFVIRVEDDGRGIDWSRLRERAESLGLSTSDEADLSEALFADGVSTASHASEYSGRGVGMGAIREACRERGGRVLVHSQPNRGTTFEFRFSARAISVQPEELLLAA